MITNSFVHSIKIPTPFAVGDVFCYLIKDDKIVLVDTGHHADDAYDCLKKGLNEHEVEIEDIDEIWLTHGHPDHYGQAALLADRAHATVFGHPLERANFAGNDDGELFEYFFNRHNIPSDFTRQMIEQLDWLQQYQLSIEPEWIQEGDELTSGTLTASVHHTPGHAPGHVAFKTDQDVIFGGDLLLGHISTNALINFDVETNERNKSLLQYRKSLQWVREQHKLVLPGHGKVIENPKVVADHHLSEHQKRYQKIKQILQEKPRTLLELSYEMFADAIKNGAIFLVLSEVLGYLDWGREEGTIEVDESNMKYRVTN
ncbi:MBL fold metallo-hydrolase [Fodinibius sp. N2]|uniref:MBL fold metallo-hydrolase n=1 Tax=Fodinibius alkaliphilus TaxID=3140241 RepID=UPI00315A4661